LIGYKRGSSYAYDYLTGYVLCRPKNFGRHCLTIQKKIVIRTYCHHDYRLDYERYFLGGKFQNSKLFCHFYYTERLPQVIYVRLF
jgi:hypothetical protein